MFDLTTIIFLALAVFIFIRLRGVLGQRTGRERPPYDPYSSRDQAPPPRPEGDNVVPLPGRQPTPPLPAPVGETDPDSDEAPAYRWEGVAPEGSSTAATLDAIARAEPDFDAKHFISGARAAYEMIVTAFAGGDRKMLKNLLASDVYEGFAAAINDRESRGETMETRFVAIEKADLEEAAMRGNSAHLTVRFVSQLISVTRDRNGNVVDGSEDTVGDVIDVWTFARDLGARDPNWLLVATETGQ